MMKRSSIAVLAVAVAFVLSSACKMQDDSVPQGAPVHGAPGRGGGPAPGAGATNAGAAPGARVVIEHPPPVGEVAPIVRGELEKAQRDGRRLVVYEGATWCQPCQQLHRAIDKGELDAAFPQLTLLEFDADRDGERLLNAGYTSRYIPLLALPNADGSSSGKQVEGGVKGDGTVALISNKLRGLLASN